MKHDHSPSHGPSWVIVWMLAFALIYVCCKSHGAELPHALGFRSSPHGVKGAPIETHSLFRAAPLPPAASVAQYFFWTDQKDRGACVAFTTWEAFAAVYMKNFGERLDLSALDIYQQCLVADGSFPNDNGTYGGTAIKVMLTSGALLEKRWPYSNALNKLPGSCVCIKNDRAQHIALKAYAIPNDDNGFAVKQCIANLKIPAMMGTRWYGNGFAAKQVQCASKDAAGNPITVTRYVLPMPKGSPVGGHEIAEVSYDDNMVFPGGEVGGVEIHNHWKEGDRPWGDARGCAWIPQKWAFNKRYVEDQVAIEIVKK